MSAPPLSTTARPNSPRERGEPSRQPMLIPPADSPNTVTCAGSPPNAATLSCTQVSAAS